MRVLTLFLCIVLSELVSISLSQESLAEHKTTIYCAVNLCMVIDGNVCCGRKAGGPESASNSVTISSYPDVMVGVLVEAGFPKSNPPAKDAAPRCKRIFQFSATARALQFIQPNEKGLGLFEGARIVPQDFGLTTMDAPGRSYLAGRNYCPDEGGNPEVGNPYYDFGMPNASKDFNLSTGDLFELSNNQITGTYGKSISTQPLELGDKETYSSDADKPGTLPNSIMKLFPTVEGGSASNIDPPTADLVSTNTNPINHDPNLDVFRSPCTGYGCDQYYYPSNFKRGTLVEFRA